MGTVKSDKSTVTKQVKKPSGSEKKVEQKTPLKKAKAPLDAGPVKQDKSLTVKKSPTVVRPKKSLKEPLKHISGMLIIKQIGSPIRRDPRQALYLKSLGLGKINRKRQVVDNASTRGLIDKLRHMVVVTEQ